jgi:hypothetical protein
MTLFDFNHGGYMQSTLQKTGFWFLTLIILSYAISVYPESNVKTSVMDASHNSQHNVSPIKQENISEDYAQAQAELMQTSDEDFVSTF